MIPFVLTGACRLHAGLYRKIGRCNGHVFPRRVFGADRPGVESRKRKHRRFACDDHLLPTEDASTPLGYGQDVVRLLSPKFLKEMNLLAMELLVGIGTEEIHIHLNTKSGSVRQV